MYLPTIGLEIHVELKTKTKMFCACLNDPDERHPNTNVCPVCLGHPGTLPTINRKAVETVLRIGLALGGKIAENSHFDRKSYFYPDLPKGYQISQYERPLVLGGELNGIRIRRIHLEEDTGRLIHETRGKGQAASLVDFNRAGVPLMELVTEPDVKNAEEAVKFAKELQLILRYLDASDADMEKGQMRVEANVSVRSNDDQIQPNNKRIKENKNEIDENSLTFDKNSGVLGVKVEVKNINSLRAVGAAIEYEIKRQERILRECKKVIQETRGWNEKKRITESQRSKESAHDYRYFPEPDLPPLKISKYRNIEWDLDNIRRCLPELPAAKRERLAKEYNLNPQQTEILIEDRKFAEYFEEAASELKSRIPNTKYQILMNYLSSDLKGLMRERETDFKDLKINPEEFAHLIAFIEEGKLSSRMAKDLLIKMFETGEDPETLLKEGGARLISEGSELTAIINEVLEKNPRAVADYKKGKSEAIQFLIGQAMAKTKGQASPDKLKEVILTELNR